MSSRLRARWGRTAFVLVLALLASAAAPAPLSPSLARANDSIGEPKAECEAVSDAEGVTPCTTIEFVLVGLVTEILLAGPDPTGECVSLWSEAAPSPDLAFDEAVERAYAVAEPLVTSAPVREPPLSGADLVLGCAGLMLSVGETRGAGIMLALAHRMAPESTDRMILMAEAFASGWSVFPRDLDRARTLHRRLAAEAPAGSQEERLAELLKQAIEEQAAAQ